MHIFVLEQDPSSRRGGQELVLLDFCRGLSQRGHSINLIHVKTGDLLEQYQKFCHSLIRVNSFTISRKPHLFLLDIWRTVSSLLAESNSIVLSNRFQDSFFGRILALFIKVPFICYVHALPPKNSPSTLAELQWKIGLKGVDQFITVSNQTKSNWIKSSFKEDKINVIYNGIDLEVYKPSKDICLTRKEWNIPENTKVISYVGRLDREKGLDTIIKAFAALLRSGISIRLLIAGKTVLQGEEYKQSLEQLVADLGIEEHVSFLGHVSNTTFVYQVSDVTVLASRWPEPFPRSIIESMACGTPAVASRTGGIPENLTGEFQAGLFEPENEQELANTLSRMMNWRDQDPQLGERCRKHVLSKFTLERMVDNVEKILLRASGGTNEARSLSVVTSNRKETTYKAETLV